MSTTRILKLTLLLIIGGIFFGGIYSLDIVRKAYIPNVRIINDRETFLYIKSNYNYDSVINDLAARKLLRNIKTFAWTANRKNYKSHVKAGRYLLKHRMSNNELINMLRSGNQEPVNLTFNNIRTKEQFAAIIAKQLEFEKQDLLELINSKEIQEKYGFNDNTISCLFIPNTYQFFWNISAEGFIDRMYNEYQNFWKLGRRLKAEKLNMSYEEIITLASIVDEETKMDDEKDMVAGLYLNRINKGMRLQADPTIIFALGDYSIRRVLNKHRKLDSPYNTYKYAGLPPGPICYPEISSIDAVLNYTKHKYFYMCAKPDFSGYHNFARTLSEHNKNARAYQHELNKKRIYR